MHWNWAGRATSIPAYTSGMISNEPQSWRRRSVSNSEGLSWFKIKVGLPNIAMTSRVLPLRAMG